MSIAARFYFGVAVLIIVGVAAALVAGKALRSQTMLRRNLPLFVTFIFGFSTMALYFCPPENERAFAVDKFVGDWATIVTGFAVSIGLINLVVTNLQKISRQSAGYGYNVALLVGFVAMTWTGLTEGMNGEKFTWLFNWVYAPMNMTMFSILAFYIASAAFRAFRAKNSEATLLLSAAVLVMLGRISLGTVFWGAVLGWIPGMPDVSEIAIWINLTFATAGQRAILFGASLGIISFSLKILLGIERGYFGGEE